MWVPFYAFGLRLPADGRKVGSGSLYLCARPNNPNKIYKYIYIYIYIYIHTQSLPHPNEPGTHGIL